MVQDVTPRSPAERAGLRPYDVIVQVEGRSVRPNDELIRDISARQPGTVAGSRSSGTAGARRSHVKLAERPRAGEDVRRAPGADRAGPPGVRGEPRAARR